MSQQQTTVPNRRTRRSYDAARREKKNLETEIVITGERPDGTSIEEVFVIHPGRIPGAVLVDVMRIGVYHDSEAMWDVFKCVLDGKPPTDPDGKPIEGAISEYDRFQAFIRDPEIAVEADVLGDMITDMVEDASGFPTQPPGR